MQYKKFYTDVLSEEEFTQCINNVITIVNKIEEFDFDDSFKFPYYISKDETDEQLFDILKENPSWENIPIVFLTAKTDSYTQKFGSIFGNEYIKKPFDLNDLKKRIDKILKSTNQ